MSDKQQNAVEVNAELIYDEGDTYPYDPMFMDTDPVCGSTMWAHRPDDDPEQLVLFLFTEHRWKTATLSSEQARNIGETLIRWAECQGVAQ